METLVVGTLLTVWALAVVWAAVRVPPVARYLLGSLFVVSGLLNLVLAPRQAGGYVDLYGERAWLPLYRTVLTGWFADHASAVLLAAALFQVLLGVLVLVGSRATGPALLAMVAFLLVATPLAPENVLNLLFATGALLLVRRARAVRLKTRRSVAAGS